MNTSVYQMYSIVKNIGEYVRSGKERSIFSKVGKKQFENGDNRLKYHCKRFYNDIENSYYTEEDLAVAILCQYAIDGECVLGKIHLDSVLATKQIFTKKQLDADHVVMTSVYKEFKFKNPDKFFEAQEDGTNIAFVLTKKGLISLAFCVKYLGKLLTNAKENVIFNSDYKSFVHVVTKIKTILNRRKQ